MIWAACQEVAKEEGVALGAIRQVAPDSGQTTVCGNSVVRAAASVQHVDMQAQSLQAWGVVCVLDVKTGSKEAVRTLQSSYHVDGWLGILVEIRCMCGQIDGCVSSLISV